jgi:hypothetical protein
MVGDVVNDAAVTNTIVEGLQMISYPFSAPVVVSALTLTNGVAGTSVGTADNLIFYVPSNQSYKTYYLFSSGNPSFHRRWRDTSSFATNVMVNPGQSFWYRSRTNTPLTWVEKRPYTLD